MEKELLKLELEKKELSDIKTIIKNKLYDDKNYYKDNIKNILTNQKGFLYEKISYLLLCAMTHKNNEITGIIFALLFILTYDEFIILLNNLLLLLEKKTKIQDYQKGYYNDLNSIIERLNIKDLQSIKKQLFQKEKSLVKKDI